MVWARWCSAGDSRRLRQAGAFFLSVSLPLAALNLEQGSKVMASTTSRAKENSKLRDSISDTRAQIDSMQVQRAQLEEMLVQRGKKDDHVDLLKNKVKKYEKKKSYCQLCLP